MPDTTFFVSAAAVRNLKQRAALRSTGIPSSHLSEAVAAALGFKTYAALRAALAGRPTVEVPKPCNIRLAHRLLALGHNADPATLRLLPEFEHSYSPFRTFPLRRTQGVRWRAWRNLLVSAINAGLDRRLFGLSPGENWWPGAAPDSHRCAAGTYRFNVDGDLPAVVGVDAISGDELSIHVILNPRHADVEPNMFHDLSDGDATAHCWLERCLGAWIQDGGEEFSCRRSILPRLAGMTINTCGYSERGSFFL